MTYQQAYRRVSEGLKQQNITDASSDAWVLMEYITGMDRARYYADGEKEMPPKEESRYMELAKKRAERIPVQHLTGFQNFMGLEFAVNETVLVPRQETEILVEEVQKTVEPGMQVLDICTGSGCIAISLKVLCPQITVTASDFSKEALQTAKGNARVLGADVAFFQSDMFSGIEGIFDVIVSNPPYIPSKVIEDLEEEVRFHDPRSALDGGVDGLHFYRILASEAPRYLAEGGKIYMEIGHDQGEAVRALLHRAGFREISVQKDLAGLDRVISGVYNRRDMLKRIE